VRLLVAAAVLLAASNAAARPSERVEQTRVEGTSAGDTPFGGMRLVAIREDSRQRELWLLDLGDKGGARPLTHNGSINLRPSFTVDGRTILFTSFVERNANLYALSLDGSHPVLLSAEQGMNGDGRMAPDGDRIALTLTRDGNSEIYVLEHAHDPAKKKLVRLTRAWGMDASPAWSPNGDAIAFISDRSGHAELWTMRADGADPVQLTSLALRGQTPDWSPEGDRIVFSARDRQGISELYVADVATRETRRLCPGSEPRFSPDGRWIAFSAVKNGRPELYVAAVDGSSIRALAGSTGFTSPAWAPLRVETRRPVPVAGR
jgi:TolB protein